MTKSRESIKDVSEKRSLLSLPDPVVWHICGMLDVTHALKVQCLCKSTMRAIPVNRFSFPLPGCTASTDGSEHGVAKAFQHLLADGRWARVPSAQWSKLLPYFTELKTLRVYKTFHETSRLTKREGDVVKTADHFTPARPRAAPHDENTERTSGVADEGNATPGPDAESMVTAHTPRRVAGEGPELYGGRGTGFRGDAFGGFVTPRRHRAAGPPVLAELSNLVIRRSRSTGMLGVSEGGHQTDGCGRSHCSPDREADTHGQFLGSRLSLNRYNRRSLPLPIASPALPPFQMNNCGNSAAAIIDMRMDQPTATSRTETDMTPAGRIRERYLPQPNFCGTRPEGHCRVPVSESPSLVNRPMSVFEGGESPVSSPQPIVAPVFTVDEVDIVNSPVRHAQRAAAPRPSLPQESEYTCVKLEAFNKFCSILEIWVQCRRTLETFKCSSVPENASFVLDNDSVIPELPVRFVRDPQSKDCHKPLEFTALRKLSFGKTIDCRHIVPLIDFCVFPRLRSLQIGVISLDYHDLAPRFGYGKSPTVVLAPQLIFGGPDCEESGSEGDGDDLDELAEVMDVAPVPQFRELPLPPNESAIPTVLVGETNAGEGSTTAVETEPSDFAMASENRTAVQSGQVQAADFGATENRATENRETTEPTAAEAAVDVQTQRRERQAARMPFANPHLPAIYNGALDENLRFEGPGVYCSHHYLYEGSFEEGLNSGFGVMTSRDGERYEGTWLRGRRHGKGKVVQADERILEGDWWYDVFEGRGTMLSPHGLRYHGEWRSHTWHGWGVVSLMGRVLVFGQFSNGLLNGWNRAIAPDGASWLDANFDMGTLVEEVKKTKSPCTTEKGDLSCPKPTSTTDVTASADGVSGRSSTLSSENGQPAQAACTTDATIDFLSNHIRETLDHLRCRVAKRLPPSPKLNAEFVHVTASWPYNVVLPDWLVESALQFVQFDV